MRPGSPKFAEQAGSKILKYTVCMYEREGGGGFLS